MAELMTVHWTILNCFPSFIRTPTVVKIQSSRFTQTVDMITKLHIVTSVSSVHWNATAFFSRHFCTHLKNLTWVRLFRLTSFTCWSRFLAGMYCKLMTDAPLIRTAGELGLDNLSATLAPTQDTLKFTALPKYYLRYPTIPTHAVDHLSITLLPCLSPFSVPSPWWLPLQAIPFSSLQLFLTLYYFSFHRRVLCPLKDPSLSWSNRLPEKVSQNATSFHANGRYSG